eukprot:1044069-Prorocentrum_lima.AAC.1
MDVGRGGRGARRCPCRGVERPKRFCFARAGLWWGVWRGLAQRARECSTEREGAGVERAGGRREGSSGGRGGAAPDNAHT